MLRGADPRLLGAPAWWIFDGMVLWATFHTLGEPPALAILAFAYLAGQVGNTVPIPGAVSGGMVGTLLAFGVEADLALSAVLAYRAIAIWLPAPVGLVALGALRTRIARWSRRGCGRGRACVVRAGASPSSRRAGRALPPAHRAPPRPDRRLRRLLSRGGARDAARRAAGVARSRGGPRRRARRGRVGGRRRAGARGP